MLSTQELLELDRDLTTEEIQFVRVALGMKPQSDVVESTTSGAETFKLEVSNETHWDEIERTK